jgi:hypothetical protein
MSDDFSGRLPEHREWRWQRFGTFRLDGDGYRIYVTALPEVIIAYLGDEHVVMHVPEEVEVEGKDDEWQVFEDMAMSLHLRVRLFEEPDESRVIAFHSADPWDSHNVSYEWNIDSSVPDRSGWRPLRPTPPIDEWAPDFGKLAPIAEDIQALVLAARTYDPRAIAAATDLVDLDTEIDDLVPWLHKVQDAIAQKFSAEWARNADPDHDVPGGLGTL